MADLAPLRTPHEAGLTGREGWEVVVVHEPLAVDRIDAVDHLVHASGSQSCEVQHLGLTALEQARSVRRGNDLHLRRHGSEIAGATTVDADTLSDDTGPHRLLGDRPNGAGNMAIGVVHVGELWEQLGDQIGLEGRLGILPLGLVGNGLRRCNPLGTGRLDRVEHLGGVVGRDVIGHDLRCTHSSDQLLLELDGLTDVLLGELQTAG